MSFLASTLDVSEWLNTPDGGAPDVRDKIVALHFFQMLCPGCVLHGLPQAQRLLRSADPQRVAVVGVHSVFEHHDAMEPAALKAFIAEFGYSFPIAIDRASDDGPIPRTMKRLNLRGTPTWLLIDRNQRVRAHIFGRIDDLVLGLEIGALMAESRAMGLRNAGAPAAVAASAEQACRL